MRVIMAARGHMPAPHECDVPRNAGLPPNLL